MKINGLDKAACIIYFDETDGEYTGRTLSLDGEKGANYKEFFFDSSEMYWRVQSKDRPNSFVGEAVDDSDKERLVAYLVNEAKKLGYSLISW